MSKKKREDESSIAGWPAMSHASVTAIGEPSPLVILLHRDEKEVQDHLRVALAFGELEDWEEVLSHVRTAYNLMEPS